MPTEQAIVVIGGGIAGLSAAFELHLRSVPFTLLEAGERFGGLVFTEHVDGYTIDSGADSLLVQKPAGLQLCEELGLSSRLIPSTPPRTAFIHARGTLHKLPSPSVLGIPTTEEGIAVLRPADGIRQGSVEGSRQGRTRRIHCSSPARGRIRRGFLPPGVRPETVGLIAQPLLGGIHAGDVEQLSIASVAPRLAAAAREPGGAMRALLGSAPAATGSEEGLFRSLRGGMGEIVEAIVARLPPASLRPRNAAVSIACAGGLWRVTTTDRDFTARAVIVAAPAFAAAAILAGADPESAALFAGVPYVSTVSVAFGWPRGDIHHALQGSGFVVAREHSHLRISACTWASSKWPDRTPDGMALVRAFLGGATDPEAASLPDDETVAVAVRDVSDVLGITTRPAMVRVRRWTRAGAQHNVGHRSRVSAIAGRLSRTPGLFAAGSGFRSIGVPDCIADGRSGGSRRRGLR